MRQARMILQRRLVIRLCHYPAISESAMPRRMRMGRQILAPPIPSGGLAHSERRSPIGVYAVEESFSKELVERQGKRNGPIFSLKDELGEYFWGI